MQGAERRQEGGRRSGAVTARTGPRTRAPRAAARRRAPRSGGRGRGCEGRRTGPPWRRAAGPAAPGCPARAPVSAAMGTNAQKVHALGLKVVGIYGTNGANLGTMAPKAQTQGLEGAGSQRTKAPTQGVEGVGSRGAKAPTAHTPGKPAVKRQLARMPPPPPPPPPERKPGHHPGGGGWFF
jgi:hypothetical protein